VKKCKDTAKDYRDMVYNAHTILKDYHSYDDIMSTPLRDIIDDIEYFTPKLKEITRRQEADRLRAEFSGKANMVKPGGRRYE